MYFHLRKIIWISFLAINSICYAQKKPNIILIMADDMGYSDIGCYGSEIPTPNLDALAANGLRFSHFYNTARCSPTRASLITGLHPHQAGMGRLAEESVGLTATNPEGYLGYLNKKCVTIAEALKPAGYSTYMSGKWHLGMRDESKWPLQRGFDRFYGLYTGATSYFQPDKPRELSSGNTQLPIPTNSDFYTTDAFTDFAIKTVEENDKSKPFFLYLAFNAPHWPLHAREEDIKKFVGKYRMGWDKLRETRLAKQKKLGIVAKKVNLSVRDEKVRAWESLSEGDKTNLDYRMAVYAAQIHRMDYGIGKLISTLKRQGQFENTLIVFLSDNGACAEPYSELGGGGQEDINNPKVRGPVSYGTGWANASNTPFQKFKSMTNEGGIATPLIVHWPKGLKVKTGSINTNVGYLVDIMPTFLEVAGATYPQNFQGQTITPLEGISLAPNFAKIQPIEMTPRTLYWEQYGFKAIRDGDMKAVFSPRALHDKTGSGQWELFDLKNDCTEMQNLASKEPKMLEELTSKWDQWAARSQVFPIPTPVNLKK